MKVASLAEMKSHLSEYVKDCEEGPIVVTRNGKPVALLLGIGDQEEIDRMLLAHNPRFQRILAEARKRLDAGEGIPSKEFWASLAETPPMKKKAIKRRKTA